jgi:hypothetical protein
LLDRGFTNSLRGAPKAADLAIRKCPNSKLKFHLADLILANFIVFVFVNTFWNERLSRDIFDFHTGITRDPLFFSYIRSDGVQNPLDLWNGWYVYDNNSISDNPCDNGELPESNSEAQETGTHGELVTGDGGKKRGTSHLGHPSSGGDGFDNHDEGRDNESSKKPKLVTVMRRFACPFFKNEPSKYVDKRSCTGPGFSSISRLK